MSPRLDFSPFRTHYFFLVTTVLAALGWLLALIFQAIATAQFGHRAVGSLWFAILLQGALNAAVILAITTDSIQTAAIQLAMFSSTAIVFAVQGTDLGIFSREQALQAMGAGYLVLAVVDIVWVLYFTSTPDSLLLHVLARTGLASPARPRRPARSSAALDLEYTTMATPNKPDYALGSGVGSPDMGVHEPKSRRGSAARSVIGTLTRPPSVASLKRSGTARSSASRKSLVGSSASAVPDAEPDLSNVEVRPPMGAVVPMPVPPLPIPSTIRGLYSRLCATDAGSPDDPNELSFQKGEILQIEDQEGKWWQARKTDGTFGVVPSNYLVMI
ncbi:hypothetical protein B0H13DRAFT_1602444 [Mycena leptocephala]|nr:hypothetical protein B0H13DRAFT_1602444 [Mycena leptocephala]